MYHIFNCVSITFFCSVQTSNQNWKMKKGITSLLLYFQSSRKPKSIFKKYFRENFAFLLGNQKKAPI